MKVIPTIIGLWLHPKNTLTHSAAMERFSTSVLKSLQSRGVNIEAFKQNGCALGCRSLSGKEQKNPKTR